VFQAGLKFFFAAGILLLLPWAPVKGAEPHEMGIIKATRLHMRSAPERTSASLFVLQRGAKVSIIGSHEGWLKIKHNDRVGYIRNREEYIQIVIRHDAGESRRPPSVTPQSVRDANKLEKKSKAIDREIEKHRGEVLTFTKKETAEVERLNKIDQSLDHARKQISRYKKELVLIKKKIDQTASASLWLKSEIEVSEVYMSKRLVALYKLSRLGRIQILASAETMFDLFKRKAALEKILTHDEKIRKKLIAQRTRFEQVLSQLKQQGREKAVIESKYKDQVRSMSQDRVRRSKLLAEIRDKKSMELAAIEVLKKAARALDRTIQSLKVEKYTPPLKIKTVEKPFLELKGLLKMPVKGKIVTKFGIFRDTRFNIEHFRSGVDIQAERGEPIRAVSSGRVLYSSWFRGYGNMVIIDHGHNYYTVYAHAEETFKTKGDRVGQREVIATVGDSGSMKGPGLYFEIRHHGKPLNPMDWIDKG
jgi:septal ring factor EnvC (AmiA/AmiB activator)